MKNPYYWRNLPNTLAKEIFARPRLLSLTVTGVILVINVANALIVGGMTHGGMGGFEFQCMY